MIDYHVLLFFRDPECWIPGIGIFNFALDRKILEIPKIGIGVRNSKRIPKILSWTSPQPGDRDLFFRDIPKLLVAIIKYYIMNISVS